VSRRPAQYADAPFLDYWLGRYVGKVLRWLAIRALTRGDFHEFNHIYAGVHVGNSYHEGGKPCVVPNDRPIFSGDILTVPFPLKGEQDASTDKREGRS